MSPKKCKEDAPIKGGIVCWACGKFTMIKVESWYKCTRCGATWVDLPEKLGSPSLTVEVDNAAGGFKYKPYGRARKHR